MDAMATLRSGPRNLRWLAAIGLLLSLALSQVPGNAISASASPAAVAPPPATPLNDQPQPPAMSIPLSIITNRFKFPCDVDFENRSSSPLWAQKKGYRVLVPKQEVEGEYQTLVAACNGGAPFLMAPHSTRKMLCDCVCQNPYLPLGPEKVYQPAPKIGVKSSRYSSFGNKM